MGLVNLGWNWRESNRTIATILRKNGYETRLFGHQHEVRNDCTGQLGFEFVSPRKEHANCDTVTPRLCAFLEDRGREQSRPFYARVGFTEVHRPYHYPHDTDLRTVELPAYAADTPGARQDFADYDADVAGLDAAVGRILAALDQAGLTHNTLVVFTTDHGSPFPRAKGTLYDPGIHTALMMRLPGVVPEGRHITELISNVDLLPTIAELTGSPAPSTIQGRSFLPLLSAGDYSPRSHIFAEKNTLPGDTKRAIRTERYKYILNLEPGPELWLPTDIEGSLSRRDMGNEHLRDRPPVELYDLVADPAETQTLAGRPDLADTETALAEILDQERRETGDPSVAGPIPRPSGEAIQIARAKDGIAERSPFARDGLISGFDL